VLWCLGGKKSCDEIYMIKKGYSILVLPGWYPNRTNTTLGNFVQKHAEAANLLCEISVVYACPDKNLKGTNFEIVIENVNGILTIIVYYKKVDSSVPIISSIQKLRRYIRANRIGYKKLIEEKGKPNLVHLNILIKAGLFAYYLKLRYGLNYVYSENWTGFLSSNPVFKPFTFQHAVYAFIANRSKVLMPVTENLKNALIGHGIKGNYQIVGNVVDTDVFKPTLQADTNKKFRFIHISHAVDDHKNISGILRAVEKLTNIRNDFELTIISDGDLKPHITYAKKLEILDTHVSFEHTLPTTEIAHRLSQSDCLILFSNYENLPCVIPEAMACGVPIISTNVGGIAEHITNETGILISPRNDNELVMAMRKMMDHYNNYSSQKLRAYAVKHFSYDMIGEAFHSAYKAAITQHA
jgi:glycosyltransferase involved in cell wall biosynthesis